ncbi:MAG TPA: VOC family protein [Gemmatimonadaceae bacterium]
MSDIRPAQGAGPGDAPRHPFVATSLAASLTAGDLQTSVAWYRDVLGFAVEREFERGGAPFAVRLRAGSVALLLTQDNGARGSDRVKGVGFSLRLTTTQNIDDLATRIKACGATLESEPADAWGARVFHLRDPDGFLLVISSEQ